MHDVVERDWGELCFSVFFFSSRRRHTRLQGDWSSDVCSSDLELLHKDSDFIIKHRLGVSGNVAWRASRNLYAGVLPYRPIFYDFNGIYAPKLGTRSEERRVGKECRYRWAASN